ncbi:hypothetical protein DE146DRAFT_773661 [Phaeosphaeria sp. MPI-PUGE-AT-0046c]|nr:hypothetical protein DE146DRAFT_773661 [Phaeosphaeria sp. MPI-PUGE-AT-0046c]
MERPDAMERKISFNPEAATFSPVATPARPAEGPVLISGAPTTVAHDSPLQPIAGPAVDHLVNSDRALEAISIDDLVSMGVPVETLMKTFEQNYPGQITNCIGGFFHHSIPPLSAMGNPASFQMQSSTFPSNAIEPNYKSVDIDELSASLGLPGAKSNETAKASPARGHRSRPSQGPLESALYGKLIDRALAKPLTAGVLAQYMQSRSESSDDTIRPPRKRSDSLGTPNTEQTPALKLVRPPPGFGDQLSRIVTEEAQQVPRDTVTTLQNSICAAPPGYFHKPAVPFLNHAHRSSNTRRLRSYTRTRRTDQGPEPSVADIYPDDAHWTPSQPAHRYQYPAPSYLPPAPQPVVRAEDVTSWPTPAEVYDPKAKVPTTTHFSQMLNHKDSHVPPTAEDLAAADAAVLSLLDELPEPKINTLLNFGALDLLADERPLSPAQESGKRYGLNFHSLGLADPWQPPMALETDPFRVRPRNHEGWGGWDWAMKNGWAM